MCVGEHGLESPLPPIVEGFPLPAHEVQLREDWERIRQVAWKCMKLSWGWFYRTALSGHYPCPGAMFSHVEYFWVSIKYRSITVHFDCTTKVHHLCVSSEQSLTVQSGGGFHTIDGHHVTFCFRSLNMCYAHCYAPDCVEKEECLQGRELFVMPQYICSEADTAFYNLD